VCDLLIFSPDARAHRHIHTHTNTHAHAHTGFGLTLNPPGASWNTERGAQGELEYRRGANVSNVPLRTQVKAVVKCLWEVFV